MYQDNSISMIIPRGQDTKTMPHTRKNYAMHNQAQEQFLADQAIKRALHASITEARCNNIIGGSKDQSSKPIERSKYLACI